MIAEESKTETTANILGIDSELDDKEIDYRKLGILPPGFPHRLKQVPGSSDLFHVPKYITRIDIDEFGKAGTHGWQVRYSKPTAFFSDSCGEAKSCRLSLEKAVSYLAAIYAGPKISTRSVPTVRKKNPIQEPGIRLVNVKKANRSVTEVYVEAMTPGKPLVAKRFYVGTCNTVTQERMDAAIRQARAARGNMVKIHNSTKGH